VSREETDNNAPAQSGDFFRQWMTQFAAQAKIHTFLDDQKAKKK
jgi:hypothetical protein